MYTQGVLTKQHFDTKTSGLTASFTVDTSIAAPTVIYQSSEYWCTSEAGCKCSYSYLGDALPASSFTEELAKNGLTNFTVTDDSYTGKTIDISCKMSEPEPVQILTA